MTTAIRFYKHTIFNIEMFWTAHLMCGARKSQTLDKGACVLFEHLFINSSRLVIITECLDTSMSNSDAVCSFTAANHESSNFCYGYC